MTHQTLKDFAVDFETKGVNLYMSLASKTSNLLGKELFYSLAEQEVQHARLIEKMYIASNIQQLVTNTSDIETELKEFWEGAQKLNLKKDPGDLSGYELAMEMEQKSISSYQSFLEKSDSEQERIFLKWVIEEEKKHLDALRNVYYYLSNTGDWFQNEESKIWNWMNQ
ncbi:MAG TPA: ferritin family protein [bacterium]|nr:ferritin family protein [bacterium]HOL35171.1 ferritin family protein [bacterium]HPP09047.1 ferritin family protein [bacterium]